MTVKERILERLQEKVDFCNFVASAQPLHEKQSEFAAKSFAYSKAIAIINEEFAKEPMHRPCPKCGGPGKVRTAKRIVNRRAVPGYWIGCDNATCRIPASICNTEESAWAAWDRREGEEISKYQRVEGE